MLEELKFYIPCLVILLLLIIGGLIGLGFFLYCKCNYTLFWSIMTPVLVLLVSAGVNLIIQLIWWVIKKLCDLE